MNAFDSVVSLWHPSYEGTICPSGGERITANHPTLIRSFLSILNVRQACVPSSVQNFFAAPMHSLRTTLGRIVTRTVANFLANARSRDNTATIKTLVSS